MLSGLLAVLQAPFVDSVLLDPFSLLQDLVATPEVDISGCQVLQALVISPVIVVADEPADLPLEIAGEEVVFQKDAVLQGLVPSSPLAGRRLLANAEREFSRECLAIKAERELNSTDVIDVLADLFILRGPPAYIRSDNGPEFVAQAVRDWIEAVGARTAYIEPGSP